MRRYNFFLTEASRPPGRRARQAPAAAARADPGAARLLRFRPGAPARRRPRAHARTRSRSPRARTEVRLRLRRARPSGAAGAVDLRPRARTGGGGGARGQGGGGRARDRSRPAGASFPGLVNAHDVLDLAPFPPLGRPPFRSLYEWTASIEGDAAEVRARARDSAAGSPLPGRPAQPARRRHRGRAPRARPPCARARRLSGARAADATASRPRRARARACAAPIARPTVGSPGSCARPRARTSAARDEVDAAGGGGRAAAEHGDPPRHGPPSGGPAPPRRRARLGRLVSGGRPPPLRSDGARARAARRGSAGRARQRQRRRGKPRRPVEPGGGAGRGSRRRRRAPEAGDARGAARSPGCRLAASLPVPRRTSSCSGARRGSLDGRTGGRRLVVVRGEPLYGNPEYLSAGRGQEPADPGGRRSPRARSEPWPALAGDPARSSASGGGVLGESARLSAVGTRGRMPYNPGAAR